MMNLDANSPAPQNRAVDSMNGGNGTSLETHAEDVFLLIKTLAPTYFLKTNHDEGNNVI